MKNSRSGEKKPFLEHEETDYKGGEDFSKHGSHKGQTSRIYEHSKLTIENSAIRQRSKYMKIYFFHQRRYMTNLDSILKNRHYFADKGPSSQIYGFSSSDVWSCMDVRLGP